MTRTHFLALAAVVACAACLAGCTAAPVEAIARQVTFSDVDDRTGSDFYYVGSSIKGTSDEFGDRLIVPLHITNSDQIVISPVADITFPDGSTLHCEETDPRRHPSLVETTTDAEIPCDGALPEDVTGATVVVTDSYH